MQFVNPTDFGRRAGAIIAGVTADTAADDTLPVCGGPCVRPDRPRSVVGADGAVGPADVRAILARADSLGFVLVGDPDGQITTLMRAASEGPGRADAAYGLVRLTFRRR